jgi:hypothetical protein
MLTGKGCILLFFHCFPNLCAHHIIGYGDWGRNPNLKNNTPSPGIGFRRRMVVYFQTLTVNEYLTYTNMPLFKLALQAKNIQEAYKKQKLATLRGIIYYVVLALQEAKRVITNLELRKRWFLYGMQNYC